MLKKYTMLKSGLSSYQIGERNGAGDIAYIYKAYFDDKTDTFTLYPQKEGYRAPGVLVQKKKIHVCDVG